MAKGKSNTLAVIIIVVVLIVAAILALVLFYLNGDTVETRTMVQISKDGKKVAEISDVEYKYKLITIMQQFEQAYNITTAEEAQNFWLRPIDGEIQLDQIKNFTLEQLKYEKVEYLKATENSIKLSAQEKDELKASFDALEKQFKDANENIDNYLTSAYGISFKMYKKISEDNKLAGKFTNLQINDIEVSDAEIKDYYENNIDTYYTVRVRHILISNKDSEGNKLEGDALQEKKDKAEDILAKVNAGEDMDALVEEYSEDGGSVENFGYYDVSENVGFAEEFKSWAIDSKVGDTGIVETEFGYHIMKTYAVTQYDDIKLRVKKDLQTSKYSEILSGWVAEYDIEVFDSVYDDVNPF